MFCHHSILAPVLLGLTLVTGRPALAQDSKTDKVRSAAAILSDYENVYMPLHSDGSSPEAVAAFRNAIKKGCLRKAEFALELYVSHPDHPRLAEVLGIRWAAMTNALDKPAEVLTDVETVLADCKRKDIRCAAHLAACWAALNLPNLNPKKRLAIVEKGIETNPDDDRCPRYLAELALRYTPDPKQMKALLGRATERWSNPRSAAHQVVALRRGLALVGKKVECEFVDLETGNPISLTDSDNRFTIIHLDSGYGDQSEPVAQLARIAKRVPDLRVLTVFPQGAGRSGEKALARAKKEGVAWPVHRDPRHKPSRTLEQYKHPTDPWAKYQRLRFLLLDAHGKLVGWSHNPETLARRIKALRSRSF